MDLREIVFGRQNWRNSPKIMSSIRFMGTRCWLLELYKSRELYPFNLGVRCTSFVNVLVFFIFSLYLYLLNHQLLSSGHGLVTTLGVEMLAVLLLLSLSTSSATIYLSRVADVVSAIQRHFYSTCTLLLPTRERCKYQQCFQVIWFE
jgi:hypothetical protein